MTATAPPAKSHDPATCSICTNPGAVERPCPKCGHKQFRRYDDSAYEWGWGGSRAPWDNGSYDVVCAHCDWGWPE